ncbi:hypothetical protein NECAME_02089 [Necator americanus]|uniref:tRNA synthetases class I (E and Q) anti-codon binding domain-containing protein n=1 Tax=Necator americanus TaxID=51031 RepID=W2TJL7_NECAM|nr:hypothetical protein NECAME_02089 [Necator americanus]ETN81799.1 hypothetical protein NECAME_02089 [Necator americanus]
MRYIAVCVFVPLCGREAAEKDAAFERRRRPLDAAPAKRDSLTVLYNVLIDKSITNSKVYDRYQFERVGYFSVDPDTVPGKVMSVAATGYRACEREPRGFLCVMKHQPEANKIMLAPPLGADICLAHE